MVDLNDDPVIRKIQERLDGHAAYIKALEGIVAVLLESSNLESDRIEGWINEACRNPTGFVGNEKEALDKANFVINATEQNREANRQSE